MGGSLDAVMPVSMLRQIPPIEMTADAVAVTAVDRLGFDPEGLLRYVNREQPTDRVFNPLPQRAARAASLEEVIRELPKRASYVADSSAFDSAQDQARAEQRVAASARPSMKRGPAN